MFQAGEGLLGTGRPMLRIGQLQGIHWEIPSGQVEMRVCGLRARSRPGLLRSLSWKPGFPHGQAGRASSRSPHACRLTARCGACNGRCGDDTNRCAPSVRNVCIPSYDDMLKSPKMSNEVFLEYPGIPNTNGPTDQEGRGHCSRLTQRALSSAGTATLSCTI